MAWQPVGAAMGVVDVCSRYIKQREQFGAPLASFQLIQERMVRMLATVQAMFLMAHRSVCLAGIVFQTHVSDFP